MDKKSACDNCCADVKKNAECVKHDSDEHDGDGDSRGRGDVEERCVDEETDDSSCVVECECSGVSRGWPACAW